MTPARRGVDGERDEGTTNDPHRQRLAIAATIGQLSDDHRGREDLDQRVQAKSCSAAECAASAALARTTTPTIFQPRLVYSNQRPHRSNAARPQAHPLQVAATALVESIDADAGGHCRSSASHRSLRPSGGDPVLIATLQREGLRFSQCVTTGQLGTDSVGSVLVQARGVLLVA